jgi:hypothetical protein
MNSTNKVQVKIIGAVALLIFFFLSGTISSCSKTKTAEPSNLVCVPDSLLSYSNHVEPILMDQCGGCHYASFGPVNAGINLEGYDNAKSASALECVVRYANGCTPMPPSGKMNDSLVGVIRCWINNGYPR